MIIPYKELLFSRETLKEIPKQPGIYQMIDAEGIIMYIGKSKSLNSRVRSYFNKEHETEKLNRMVMFVDKIKVFMTETHLDAMLLEVELIKENRPLYNSQFKKSDQYNYLDFSGNQVFAISNNKPVSRSLGPFRNSEYLNHFKSLVLKLAPITKEICYHVIPKRISSQEMKGTREYIFQALTNQEKYSEFKSELERLMVKYSSNLEFETAAFMKFSLTVLEYLSRTTLSQVDCIYYDNMDEGVKAYKISDYTVVGYNYFNSADDITDHFYDVSNQVSEKDILDHQLVVYHELKKNPNHIKK